MFEQAARVLKNAACAIASTGAGISVESGIPDFRGPHGIWTKYPPDEYATIDAFMANPEKVWGLWREIGATFLDCQPNPGHRALAELERLDRLHAVITQNVDNLHQLAGSAKVVEYHGNARRLTCLKCRARVPYEPGSTVYPPVPTCACGGLLKPDVVMFGEMIPKHAMFEAEVFAQKCDVVIVVGTSAQVFPAAELPFAAKQRGAYIIEANIERTDFTETITDAFLEGPAGETLPKLVETLKSLG